VLIGNAQVNFGAVSFSYLVHKSEMSALSTKVNTDYIDYIVNSG